MKLENILAKEELSREDIIFLLNLEEKEDLEKLYNHAYEIKVKHIGKKVFYRGLIEFSNICVKNCDYCGIRKDNINIDRFDMNESEILEMASWAHKNNYGSVTLQSGERYDENFINFIDNIIKKIKINSNNEIGITLCLGEQSEETYKKWFNSGAHRYLLRIETTNKKLYETIHPKDSLHSFENRVNSLNILKKIGYQVGTGVMIGLPNQSIESLADDIIFFKEKDIDMIGMGPYIISKNTPLGEYSIKNELNTREVENYRFELGLKMIAITRIYLKDVNIAATTALQALNPLGREKGIKSGANILMPIITLPEYREKYQLYDNKPCIEDTSEKCKQCLGGRVKSVGEEIGYGEWGDSPHFNK